MCIRDRAEADGLLRQRLTQAAPVSYTHLDVYKRQDLRGAISNDSMTDDERKLLEEERARTEEAAKLRDEDYQLAYAVDILRGLNAVAPKP